MSVKTASEFVTRAMRAAIRETISPANQETRETSEGHTSGRVRNASLRFGHELHQRLNAYTGSVDEFGGPDNIVDNWRLQFSRRESEFKPANSAGGKPLDQG